MAQQLRAALPALARTGSGSPPSARTVAQPLVAPTPGDAVPSSGLSVLTRRPILTKLSNGFKNRHVRGISLLSLILYQNYNILYQTQQDDRILVFLHLKHSFVL